MNRLFFTIFFCLFASSVYAQRTSVANNRFVSPVFAQQSFEKIRQKQIIDNLDFFPLWNSSWIVGKGQNDGVYPSISKAVPTHLIKVTFPRKPNLNIDINNIPEEVTLEYAVLTGQRYKSTSHMINEALHQFARNRVTIRVDSLIEKAVRNEDSPVMISQRKLQDTLWYCDDVFRDIRHNEPNKYSSFLIQYGDYGVDTMLTWTTPFGAYRIETMTGIVSTNPGDTLFFREKPVAIGVFSKQQHPDRAKFYADFDSAHYFRTNRLEHRYHTDANDYGDDDGWRDYCDQLNCYERISIATGKSSNVSFWSIHLAPAVWWYPYDAGGLGPMLNDTLKMDFKTAKAWREISIKAPLHTNMESKVEFFKDARSLAQLKNYRRPWYSDSASCVISVQFQESNNREPGKVDRRTRTALPEYLFTSFKDQPAARAGGNLNPTFDNTNITRIPGRMVRLRGVPDDVPIAIMRLYAERDVEDELAKNVAQRCGVGWRSTDSRVGEEHRFPDSAVFNERQRRWRPGTSLPVMFRQRDFMNPRGTDEELVYADDYSAKKFTYNHCACLPIPEFHNRVTTNELRSIIYQVPPLCAVPEMSNALYILLRAQNYMTNEHDLTMLRKRITMVYNSLEERTALYRTLTPAQIVRGEAACAKSWELLFRDRPNDPTGRPLYRSAYTSDLKQGAEEVVRALGYVVRARP